MGNWVELPYDLIVLNCSKISYIFCSVCTSWRIAGTNEIYKVLLGPQVPLLMLADKDDDYREFYSLSREKVSTIFLPEARKAECYSTKGWLCTIVYTINREMNLLHPFSRTQIQLPPEKNLWAFHKFGPVEARGLFHCVDKAILSASPSVTSDYVLLVSYYAGYNNLAFWRHGDLNWNVIDKEWGAFSDINYYDGQFYGVVYNGDVWVFNIAGPPIVESRLFFHVEDDMFGQPGTEFYLVEVSGALLLVARFSHGDGSLTFKF